MADLEELDLTFLDRIERELNEDGSVPEPAPAPRSRGRPRSRPASITAPEPEPAQSITALKAPGEAEAAAAVLDEEFVLPTPIASYRALHQVPREDDPLTRVVEVFERVADQLELLLPRLDTLVALWEKQGRKK